MNNALQMLGFYIVVVGFAGLVVFAVTQSKNNEQSVATNTQEDNTGSSGVSINPMTGKVQFDTGTGISIDPTTGTPNDVTGHPVY